MDIDLCVVVIDNGARTCRIGAAGDDAPNFVFTANSGLTKLGYPDNTVGSAAQNYREIVSMKYPITRGIITNWDDMEKVWRFLYSEMKILPDSQMVLISEGPENPKANREKIAQCMFESLGVPGLDINVPCMLALYASGYLVGMVVDSGEGVTHTVPCPDACMYPNAFARSDIAGMDVTEYLQKLLAERGHHLPLETVRDLKEKHAFVSLDFETEGKHNTTDKKLYTLPDGQTLEVDNDILCKCAESIFRPSLLGLQNQAVHEMIFNSIIKCPLDCRRELYGSLKLAGGTTMLPGFADRLQKELAEMFSYTYGRVKVIAPPERKYSTWIGASILGSLSPFENRAISKKTYEEYGPAIVHRRQLY